MKRAVVALVALAAILLPALVRGEGFSSSVQSVTAERFPAISAGIKVFTPEPIPLTSDNFELFEDAAKIATFSITMEKSRQYVILVLDRSSSIEPAMPQVKQSAAGFVNTCVNEQTRTAILSFGSDIDLTRDFSTDKADLVKGIQSIRPWGGTRLYDAMYQAAETINNAAGRSDTRTILCLTDGKDESPNATPNFSTRRPEEVIGFATKNRIRIITVGLGNGIDENVLKRFATDTKGWYLRAPTPDQLARVFAEITRRLMAERRYTLSYTTPRPQRDGTRRELLVTSQLKGLKDQGKGSYTAPIDTATPKEPAPEPDRCPPFSVIHISGAADTMITLAKADQHRFERTRNEITLRVSVSSDTLHITGAGDEVLTVEAPAIRKIIVDSAGTHVITSSLPFERLEVEVGGTANVRLAGGCQRLHLKQDGANIVDFSEFQSPIVEAESTGDLVIQAPHSLKLHQTGNGKVVVLGSTTTLDYLGEGNSGLWVAPTEVASVTMSGNAETWCFGSLQKADLTLSGNNEVFIAPVASLRLKAIDNAQCKLFSQPPDVEKEVDGNGELRPATDEDQAEMKTATRKMDDHVQGIRKAIDKGVQEIQGRASGDRRPSGLTPEDERSGSGRTPGSAEGSSEPETSPDSSADSAGADDED
ncbi:MAG: VWA domain-containing protein [Candidatus Riflebacteria bacterium]|nr:VWA domain-containing protein [Candidatus Riflebacteria bacterium]